MRRRRPFEGSEYSGSLVWRAEGLISAVSNQGHRVVFLLGTHHRNLFLERMRSLRINSKLSSTKLSARERRALENEL